MASARHAMAISNCLFGTAVSVTSATRKTNIRCFTPTASLPIPPPSRFTRRRNYLRPKLLKTLKNPPPGTITPITPQEPAEELASQVEEHEFETERSGSLKKEIELSVDQNPPESNHPIADTSNNSAAEEELEASISYSNESAYNIEALRFGLWGTSARDVARYGAYIVGFYLTVKAVMMAFGGSDEENERTRNREKMGDNTAYAVGGNYGVINGQPMHLDDAEIEAKIAQIQIMARDARDKERESSVDRESESESGLVDMGETDSEEEEEDVAEDDDSSGGTSEIKKDVDGRLCTVSKRLNSTQAVILTKKSQNSLENETRDVLDKKDETRKLSFRKSYKFRSDFTPKEPNRRPKGFGGSSKEESSGSVTEKGGDNHLLRETWEVENRNGHVQGKSSVPLDDSDKPKGVEPKRNRLDNKNDDASYTDGKSRVRQVGTGKFHSKTSHKHPNNNEPDLWWHSLQYLFVIVMMNGSEDHGRQGFYTLEHLSDGYTVLFEDQFDAKNFSHIVGSYFEELKDVRISVMPLPIKTILGVMNTTQATNIIAVKKGQLKLYAGQPLTEVESVLRCLVK